MLIFNTTFHVDNDVLDIFLDHMTKKYIPVAGNSGFLHISCFARIQPQHGEEGSSYSLQLKVKNMETLNFWLEKEGEELHQEIIKKFGNKVAGFSTLLEEIDY